MGSPWRFEATRRRCGCGFFQDCGLEAKNWTRSALRRSRFGDGIGVADVGTDGERHGLAGSSVPSGSLDGFPSVDAGLGASVDASLDLAFDAVSTPASMSASMATSA